MIMKFKTKSMQKTFVGLLMAASLFTACKKDDTDAKVAVKLTDDPFPIGLVAEANIGVAKIELKNSNGDYITVFNGNTEVNMVNYTNGATAEVNVKAVPEGKYTEAKITLNRAEISLTNGNHYNANVSASHSYSVRISPAIEVTEGNTEDLLLDLDLSDSFRFQGNFMGGWISQITGIQSFNPDFRAVCLSHTGTLEGHVVDVNGNPVAHAYVEVEYDYDGDGMPETVSTIANAHGNFRIIGLPAGQYDVEVEAENGFEGEVEDVNISVNHTNSIDVTIN
jgi:hypothetical protein